MANKKLNTAQIRLVKTACRKAGLITKTGEDGRYRLLLAQYKAPNGRPVRSCRDLTNRQLDDLLAICESLGWRCPGKDGDYFRRKNAKKQEFASFVQQEAIRHLKGDLGMDELQLLKFIDRMTKGKISAISMLSTRDAYNIIEALKAMLSRKDGKKYKNMGDVMDEKSKELTDGQEAKT